METLEIHSKDFLVKWVHAPDNSVIDWQVKPLKKSINLAIYRKKDEKRPPPSPLPFGTNSTSSTSTFDDSNEGIAPPSPSFTDDSSAPSTPATNGSNSSSSSFRTRSGSVASVNKFTEHSVFRTKSRSSTFSSNLNNSDLTLLKNYNKLISDELVHGTFQVTNGGMFAFIFDNSFSKTTGKKVYFSSKIIKSSPDPPSVRRQSSVARASISKPIPDKKSIRFANGAIDEAGDDSSANGTILRPKNGELLQSVLSKRRRKKLQGFVKRYFVLNFKYGTLSYFKLNDNKLRGQMPIKQSIVSANPKTREIIIDSGMEIWDLKALNDSDFGIWVEAFNQIKKGSEKGEIFDEDSQTSADFEDASLADELEVVSQKLDRLRLETSYCSPDVLAGSILSISKDVHRMLAKVRPVEKSSALGDSVSVYSTNEFFDANEDVDALSSGVVLIDIANEATTYKRIDGVDEEEQFDASSTSSEESNRAESTYTDLATNVPPPSIEDDNDLHPLPFKAIQRDPEIPLCDHSPSSLVSFIRKNVGKDLSSIPMPIDMNEPLSALQKYAEMFEYCDLVNNALQPSFVDNSGEKILRIAAFAVSYFSSVRAKIRNNRKPFNPLLGETFELVREDFGIRMVSEKVSHKPVIFAFHVESEHWTFTFSPSPTQKIWGHSAEIITKGTAKLTVKKTGEIFTWNHPNTLLKNILAGEKYSEPSDSMTIKSSLGYKAVIEFAKSGMFSGRSEDLTITAYDSTKNKLPYTVSGKWTESLTLKTKTTQKLIWECGELLPNYKKKFGYTEFSGTLNKITEIDNGLAPTDSRLRPDIKLYEQGNVQKAEGVKLELEEEQRNRRKELEESGGQHVPQFFELDADTSEWVYIKGENSYWNRRKNGNWDGLIKLW